jgi:hypothetical protein
MNDTHHATNRTPTPFLNIASIISPNIDATRLLLTHVSLCRSLIPHCLFCHPQVIDKTFFLGFIGLFYEPLALSSHGPPTNQMKVAITLNCRGCYIFEV